MFVTFNPLIRNADDIAFPIPLAPPVTMATFPFKSILIRGGQIEESYSLIYKMSLKQYTSVVFLYFIREKNEY